MNGIIINIVIAKENPGTSGEGCEGCEIIVMNTVLAIPNNPSESLYIIV
jgi:hypothetical protein